MNLSKSLIETILHLIADAPKRATPEYHWQVTPYLKKRLMHADEILVGGFRVKTEKRRETLTYSFEWLDEKHEVIIFLDYANPVYVGDTLTILFLEKSPLQVNIT